MITAAHIIQELSSENNTFRAGIENLHRAEKTALKDNLAFQKIVAAYQGPKVVCFYIRAYMKVPVATLIAIKLDVLLRREKNRTLNPG